MIRTITRNVWAYPVMAVVFLLFLMVLFTTTFLAIQPTTLPARFALPPLNAPPAPLLEPLADNHPLRTARATLEQLAIIPETALPANDDTRLLPFLTIAEHSATNASTHIHAMQTIASYIRTRAPAHAPAQTNTRTPPPPDVLFALDIIAVRPNKAIAWERTHNYRIDLQNTHLAYADLSGGRFDNIVFNDSDFTHTDFTQARAVKSYFMNANMTNARLRQADFNRTQFAFANLDNAVLQDTIFEGAEWFHATLRSANLRGSNLKAGFFVGTDLTNANLQNTILPRAVFFGATLQGAAMQGAFFGNSEFKDTTLKGAQIWRSNLSNTRGLTQHHIDSAFGDARVHLPPALTTPAHWPKRLTAQTYAQAYQEWQAHQNSDK